MENYFTKLNNIDVRKIPYYCMVLTQKNVRMILFYLFRFDKWHIVVPARKPWVKATIKFLNNRELKGSCVDIGCGLGDIIRHVKFNKRFGFDLEANVLRAAKFLSILTLKNGIVFKKFNFPIDSLNEKFDAILLLSLCHITEPTNLKSTIENYFLNNLNNNGCIIIEIVHYGDKKYKYNHDINFLTNNINCTLVRIAQYYPEKEVWCIIKS